MRSKDERKEMVDQLNAVRVDSISVPQLDWMIRWQNEGHGRSPIREAGSSLEVVRSLDYRQRHDAALSTTVERVSAGTAEILARGELVAALSVELKDAALKWVDVTQRPPAARPPLVLRVDLAELIDPVTGDLDLRTIQPIGSPQLLWALTAWVQLAPARAALVAYALGLLAA